MVTKEELVEALETNKDIHIRLYIQTMFGLIPKTISFNKNEQGFTGRTKKYNSCMDSFEFTYKETTREWSWFRIKENIQNKTIWLNAENIFVVNKIF